MTPQSAAEHYRSQQALTAATLTATRKAWKAMTPELETSWPAVLKRLLTIVPAAQLAAARSATTYVPNVLDELGIDAPPVAELAPRAFIGTASDGRPLDSLLYGAVVKVRRATAPVIFTDPDDHDVTTMTPGTPMPQALKRAGRWLDMVVHTQVADAERVATATAIAARPDIPGYVRMLNPPSCSRCAVLAGKWFKWNAGFERHPLCDCRHIPASEDRGQDLRTSPDRYFHSLSREEQDRIFTKAGAESIRLGADVGQVVNARRGMRKAQVFGHEALITTEGTTRRGLAFDSLQRGGRGTETVRQAEELATRITRNGPELRRIRRERARSPRLMPEALLEIADGDRDEAIRLLTAHGYLIP